MTKSFCMLIGFIIGSVIVYSVAENKIEEQEKEIEHYKKLTKFYFKLAARRKIKDE